MTARTWIASGTYSIDIPGTWSPGGAPMAGDTLTIAQGNPTISYETLSGLTINLGGPPGQDGPSWIVKFDQYPQPPFAVELVHAPNPTMTFTNATIGLDTSITVPTVPFRGGRGVVRPANVATISMTESVNNGTIGTAAATVFLQRGGTLNLTMHSRQEYGVPDLVNNGKIVAAAGTTINLYGYFGLNGPTWPDSYGFGGRTTMTNDGVIDVIGTMTDNSVGIEGYGIINLDSAPGALGLPATPGTFLDQCESFAEATTARFAFHGGHLLIGPGYALDPSTLFFLQKFQGELDRFGGSATDMIELRGFTVDSSIFANGVLTMHSNAAGDFSLHFANMSPLKHFGFAHNGINTDITWQPPLTT
jgi:hypothetical protein